MRNFTVSYSKATLLVARLATGLRETQVVVPRDVSASSLHAVCPREHALADEHRLAREETIFADTRYLFAVGQAFHDAMQNYILGPLHLIFGKWRCCGCSQTQGDYVRGDRLPMPQKCPNCGKLRNADRSVGFSYVEDEVVDPACGFVSHPDGYDHDGDIWEFKSVGHSFSNKPKPEHMIQVQANLHAQRMARKADPRRARLVYMEKAALGVLDGIHEFLVPYDKKFAEQHYAKAVALAQYRIDGTVPVRVCTAPEDTRAVHCCARAYCFAQGAPR